MVDTAHDVASASPRRAHALDALRGFAILTMALSGLIPFGVLPDWMYHAQVPPPSHKFIPVLPGLTWVDLVFPFFLFSMGAAMPLAMSGRLDRGWPSWKLGLYAAERGFLLAGFALYVQHIRPTVMNSDPAVSTWLLALLGFALLFPILTRLPRDWPLHWRWAIRAIGWVGVVLLMCLMRYPEGSADGARFSLNRSDIIIVVLANMALFGSLIWLVTRTRPLLRLGLLGVLIAVRLSKDHSGWVQELWHYSPAPWIYTLYYLQYLFIVIPGTVVGELILQWLKAPANEPPAHRPWLPTRYVGIVVLMALFVLVLLVGMQGRWVVETPTIAVLMCVLAWRLTLHPSTASERLLSSLCKWGVYWLVLGLVFEPFEGGIKKDHATMSYYFVTTGLAIFTLVAFTIVIDVWGRKRWLNLLVANGQNPMIAYAGITNLLPPVLALTGLEALILRAQHLDLGMVSGPWIGFACACVKTLLLAYVVSLCTRFKVFWRT